VSSTICCKCNAHGAEYFACHHTGPCGFCAAHSPTKLVTPLNPTPLYPFPTDRELLLQILAELRMLNALLQKNSNVISNSDDSYEHINFKEEG